MGVINDCVWKLNPELSLANHLICVGFYFGLYMFASVLSRCLGCIRPLCMNNQFGIKLRFVSRSSANSRNNCLLVGIFISISNLDLSIKNKKN